MDLRHTKWECSVCTLLNDARRRRCEACNKTIDVFCTEELTVIIIGPSEKAKARAGNILLKNKAFDIKSPVCEVGYVVQSEYETIKVIRTSRMFEPHMDPIEVSRELTRLLFRASPGPHVFLFAVNDEEPQIDQDYLEIFLGLFGHQMLQRTILAKMTSSTPCSNFDESSKFAKYLVLHDNEDAQPRFELDDNDTANQISLIQSISHVVVENKCTYLCNGMFKYVKETIKKNSMNHLAGSETYQELKRVIRDLESKSSQNTKEIQQLKRELEEYKRQLKKQEEGAHKQEQNRFLDDKTLDMILKGLKDLGEHLFVFGCNYMLKRLTL